MSDLWIFRYIGIPIILCIGTVLSIIFEEFSFMIGIVVGVLSTLVVLAPLLIESE